MKKVIIVLSLFCLGILFCGCAKEGLSNNITTNEEETTITVTEITTELQADSKEETTDPPESTESLEETKVEDTTYAYMDFEGWESPGHLIADLYFSCTDLEFEEGDIAEADRLMRYFTLREMVDRNTHELYDYLNQYRTNPDAEEFALKNEVSIPKDVVDSIIEKHFAVKVDNSYSKYTDPEDEDYYLLFPSVSGLTSVAMKDYVVEGNRSTAVYVCYDSIDKRIFKKMEICIENESDSENFKIIYARKIEDDSVSSESTD